MDVLFSFFSFSFSSLFAAFISIGVILVLLIRGKFAHVCFSWPWSHRRPGLVLSSNAGRYMVNSNGISNSFNDSLNCNEINRGESSNGNDIRLRNGLSPKMNASSLDRRFTGGTVSALSPLASPSSPWNVTRRRVPASQSPSAPARVPVPTLGLSPLSLRSPAGPTSLLALASQDRVNRCALRLAPAPGSSAAGVEPSRLLRSPVTILPQQHELPTQVNPSVGVDERVEALMSDSIIDVDDSTPVPVQSDCVSATNSGADDGQSGAGALKLSKTTSTDRKRPLVESSFDDGDDSKRVRRGCDDRRNIVSSDENTDRGGVFSPDARKAIRRNSVTAPSCEKGGKRSLSSLSPEGSGSAANNVADTENRSHKRQRPSLSSGKDIISSLSSSALSRKRTAHVADISASSVTNVASQQKSPPTKQRRRYGSQQQLLLPPEREVGGIPPAVSQLDEDGDEMMTSDADAEIVSNNNNNWGQSTISIVPPSSSTPALSPSTPVPGIARAHVTVRDVTPDALRRDRERRLNRLLRAFKDIDRSTGSQAVVGNDISLEHASSNTALNRTGAASLSVDSSSVTPAVANSPAAPPPAYRSAVPLPAYTAAVVTSTASSGPALNETATSVSHQTDSTESSVIKSSETSAAKDLNGSSQADLSGSTVVASVSNTVEPGIVSSVSTGVQSFSVPPHTSAVSLGSSVGAVPSAVNGAVIDVGQSLKTSATESSGSGANTTITSSAPGFSFGSGANTRTTSTGSGFSFGSGANTTTTSTGSGFGFGSGTNTTTTSTGSGFSFGSGANTTTASTGSGFSFGSGANTTTTSAGSGANTTNTSSAPGFSFGSGTNTTTISSALSAGSVSVVKSSGFGCGTATTTSTTALASGFSFGTGAGTTATNSAPGSNFGSGPTPVASSAPGYSFGSGSNTTTTSSVPGFSFGSGPTTVASSAPGFSFGSGTTAVANSAPGFSFGSGTTAVTISAPGSGTTAVVSSAPGFSFGSGSTAVASSAPGFSFGSRSTVAASSTPGFSFGSGTTAVASSAPGLSFGSGSNTTTTNSTPGFSFGSGTTAVASSAPGFSFGSGTTAVASSAPGFSFGSGPTAVTTSASGFAFGSGTNSSNTAATGFAFGSTNTANPTTGFVFGSTGNTSAMGAVGASQIPNSPPSFGTGVAGTPAQSFSAGANASFGTSQQNGSPFVFGAPPAPAAAPASAGGAPGAPFVFGSPAPQPVFGGVKPANPTGSPGVFAFNGSNTGSAMAPNGGAVAPAFNFGANSATGSFASPAATGTPGAFTIGSSEVRPQRNILRARRRR